MVSYIIIIKVVASFIIARFVGILFIARKGSKNKPGTFTMIYYLMMFAIMAAAVWINY